LNKLAEILNEKIYNDNKLVYDMLSGLGKNLYFPRGILFQGAEAKKYAKKFNATIGIATERGIPIHFQETYKYFNGLSPEDLFNYAPASGRSRLRSLWKSKMIEDNPTLADKKTSLPIATNGITHGLSISADLFVDKDDNILLPDKIWGNYKLIFGLRRSGKINYYKFLDNGRFNLKGLKNSIESIDSNKYIIIFNFPNNPLGYAISKDEGDEIASLMIDIADSGKSLVIIFDDAYFGLFYESNILQESLFAYLANAHERILSIKVDGVTKEEFLWGFRLGFITFGSKNLTAQSYNALEEKTMGIIRGTISNCSMPIQTIVEELLKAGKYREEQKLKFKILQNRYSKVKNILENPKYKEVWSVYPFNSGYFLCLKLNEINAEQLRKTLLEKYEIGIIATSEDEVRIAFSCIEEESIGDLFEQIYKCAIDLKNS